jgi:hypothetical protein
VNPVLISSSEPIRARISALIAVPFFFQGVAWSGVGLLIEVVAALIGVAMGYAACSLIRFEYDASTTRTFTRAGIAYAGAWVLVAGLKAMASYGAQSWFAADLGRWMMQNDVGQNTIRAAVSFFSVGTPVTRSVILLARGAATAHRAGSTLVLYQSRAAQRQLTRAREVQ